MKKSTKKTYDWYTMLMVALAVFTIVLSSTAVVRDMYSRYQKPDGVTYG